MKIQLLVDASYVERYLSQGNVITTNILTYLTQEMTDYDFKPFYIVVARETNGCGDVQR